MFFPIHDRNKIRNIEFAYVNYSLIVLTILVFLFQVILPQAQSDGLLVVFGMIPMVVSDVIAQPIIWIPDEITFISYAFLHADWLHLLSNILFLWIFGDNIEDALGHGRYLVFYFLCAIFAALLHYYFNLDSNGPLIGASGAVAGVMGAYIMLFPFARLYVLAKIIIPIPLAVPAFWMLGFWILTQFFFVFLGSDEPVAWWAHIGGFVAGIVFALLLKRKDYPIFGGK